MAESNCVVPQVWRHVCPQIKDLSVTVSISKPYTVIRIPRELLIQGAGKANNIIQEVFKTQCGFKCTPHVTITPNKGRLEVYGNGWAYTPILPRSIPDTDRFNYRLSLNGELSLEARITITFTA